MLRFGSLATLLVFTTSFSLLLGQLLSSLENKNVAGQCSEGCGSEWCPKKMVIEKSNIIYISSDVDSLILCKPDEWLSENWLRCWLCVVICTDEFWHSSWPENTSRDWVHEISGLRLDCSIHESLTPVRLMVWDAAPLCWLIRAGPRSVPPTSSWNYSS